jgi:hypothetical protein
MQPHQFGAVFPNAFPLVNKTPNPLLVFLTMPASDGQPGGIVASANPLATPGSAPSSSLRLMPGEARSITLAVNAHQRIADQEHLVTLLIHGYPETSAVKTPASYATRVEIAVRDA